MAKQEHQFGDGRFGGGVVTAYHAHLLQVVARFVAFHLHAAGTALGDVDDNHSLLGGATEATKEPFAKGGIARAAGLQHNGF